MVDSIKKYGLKGLGDDVQVGKRNARIVSETDQIALRNVAGDLVNAVVADAVTQDQAVTLQQFNQLASNNIVTEEYEVAYNSGSTTLFTVTANSTILSISVVDGAFWNNTDGSENVIIGDAAQPDRLFSGFEPGIQLREEADYKYLADTPIVATVSPGAATSGTVKIMIMFYGNTI